MNVKLAEILKLISDSVKNSSKEVHDRFVNARIEEEISSHAVLLEKGFKRVQELNKELNKFQPDQGGGFDTEGQKLPMSFSKEKFEERNKLKQKLEKLEEAVANAALVGFEEKDGQSINHYQKLTEALQKAGQ